MNDPKNGALVVEHASRPRLRPQAVALIAAGLAVTLGACSSSGSPSAASATTAVAATSAAGGEGSHVTAWTLSSANKAAVGAYLVAESTTGEDALTVYVFSKDIPGSGASACDATCAKTWSPLVLTDGATVRVSGVTGKLAQLTRSDGTVQVTYNGAPCISTSATMARATPMG
jgi:predicted lipoprotein with Yx(FWY)xxD motif